MTAISVKNLNVSYHGEEAIKDVSFSLETGSLVGIIGPNGAGKSTLIKALLNLIPKDKGEIQICNQSVRDIRKKIAYVPQRSNIDWDFPITVMDTVLLGTYPNLGLFKRPGRKEKRWAIQCLNKVGMLDFSDRQIGELSGGQQQRVFLARALAQEAEIYFLDEPFVGVDLGSEETIIQILKELRNMGKTVFVVHHDLSKSDVYFDKLLLLNKKLVGFGPVDEVFRTDLLAKAYKGHFSFMEQIGVTI